MLIGLRLRSKPQNQLGQTKERTLCDASAGTEAPEAMTSDVPTPDICRVLGDGRCLFRSIHPAICDPQARATGCAFMCPAGSRRKPSAGGIYCGSEVCTRVMPTSVVWSPSVAYGQKFSRCRHKRYCQTWRPCMPLRGRLMMISIFHLLVKVVGLDTW